MSKYDPGGFRIDGNSKHEDDVKDTLDTIKDNPVGLILLNFIDKNPKYVHIKPYVGGGCNADTKADNPEDGAPANVTPYAGKPDGTDGTKAIGRDDLADYSGTGKGTDAHVRFSASEFKKSGCDNGQFGNKPDEVLFHELVHGYRFLGGEKQSHSLHHKPIRVLSRGRVVSDTAYQHLHLRQEWRSQQSPCRAW